MIVGNFALSSKMLLELKCCFTFLPLRWFSGSAMFIADGLFLPAFEGTYGIDCTPTWTGLNVCKFMVLN